tara:strand:+ start:1109 stop:1414 length:306 start_codon:yes stop_codon:yes gene_type:complete
MAPLQNLEEYYKYYLTLHQHPKCRLMHFIGQLMTIIAALVIFINWYWYLIPIIPFLVYPFAWIGHYAFEKNTPAAFTNPWYAKASDWLMFRDILKGRLKIW